MFCRQYEPCDEMKPYIQSYIVFEDTKGFIKNKKMTIYPSGKLELIISYGNRVLFDGRDKYLLKSGHGYLGGQILEPVNYTCFGLLKIISVIFKPWGIYRLLAVPQSDFNNYRVDLEFIFGRSFESIIERIYLTKRVDDKIRLLDVFFTERLNRTKLPSSIYHLRNAAGILEETGGVFDLSMLAELLGLNIKTLERSFKKLLGIRPKLFSRIMRFNKALNMISSGISDFNDIVFKAGYYDQSHFINEFREFTGAVPTDFLKKDEQIQNSIRELVHI
jgi:AraC-like DNA-binding protein